ncbi:MAG TPA: hypothetical protein DCL80_13730, partial [Balneola sp.]|nr:hypothetical protein [Balneola sp.]
DKGLERAEKYEKFGHLLMANGHLMPNDPTKIIVNDLYNEGAEIEIPLVEKLSVIENAERYYSKSRNSIRSYEEALERIPSLEKKKVQLEELRDEIEKINKLFILNDWKKENSEILKELGIGDQEGKEESLPFHILEVDTYPV